MTTDTDIIRQTIDTLRDVLHVYDSNGRIPDSLVTYGRRVADVADAHLSAAPQASEPACGTWKPHGSDSSMRHPEASDLSGGATDSEPAAPAAGEVADNLSDAERLAFALCEEAGDDPHTLEWEGNPPEPWGDRWMRYLPQARRLVALLSATKPAPTPPADIVRDAEPISDWKLLAIATRECGFDGDIQSMNTRDVLALMRAAIAASKGAQQ